jgi:Protein of unknown function (DUF3467)
VKKAMSPTRTSTSTSKRDRAIKVTWESDEVPTQYATNLVVQHTAHEFIITFFEIRPPLLMGTPAMKSRQLDDVSEIRARPLARIVVAATRMNEFVQVLQDNKARFDARRPEAAKEGGDE